MVLSPATPREGAGPILGRWGWEMGKAQQGSHLPRVGGAGGRAIVTGAAWRLAHSRGPGWGDTGHTGHVSALFIPAWGLLTDNPRLCA